MQIIAKNAAKKRQYGKGRDHVKDNKVLAMILSEPAGKCYEWQKVLVSGPRRCKRTWGKYASMQLGTVIRERCNDVKRTVIFDDVRNVLIMLLPNHDTRVRYVIGSIPKGALKQKNWNS
jgi:hypothetical protein